MTTNRDLHCYVCNNKAGASVRNYVAIFGENTNLDSGKKLSEVLSQILDNCVEEKNVHSSILCKKCYKSCVEFDEVYARMSGLKSQMQNQFKSTLPKYSIEYESATKDKEVSPESKKRVVLPASKLKPLPPDFVILNRGNIKVGKLSAVMKNNAFLTRKKTQPSTPQDSKIGQAAQKITATSQSSTAPMHNIKFVSVQKRITDNDLEIASLKSVDAKKTASAADHSEATKPTITLDATLLNQNNVASILNRTTAKITLLEEDQQLSPNNDIEDNPDELVANADDSLIDNEDLDAEKRNHLENIPEELEEFENNDDQIMEIDEDCSTVGIPKSPPDFNTVFKEHIKNSKKFEEKPNEKMFNLSLIERNDTARNSDEDKYVIGKVEILDDEQEIEGYDEDAILMEQDEDGSIIRVVTGKQLMYGNDEMAFEYQRGDSDSDSTQNNDQARFKSEAHDSNEDDSQIELQVSGDEETANAIIAAAKEQGGAFIKTESGIMYRVKTIESKIRLGTDKSDCLQFINGSMLERSGDTYKCLICENNTTKEDPEASSDAYSGTAQTITQHMKLVHGARIYICQICGEVTGRRNDYIKHIADHARSSPGQTTTVDKAKQHVCTICQKKYGSRNLLLEHMNVHSGARPYPCDVCDKTFASKYTHQAHLKTHLNRPRPYSCKQCDKRFFTQQNLNQHKRTHSGVKDFICNVCGKAFATQHNLVVHGVVHTGQRPFVCGICSKSFARRAEIRDHIRTHTGERPFSCDVCTATFSQRSNLRSHKRATHLDDKRHACPHCDKRFKRRRLLDYHIKATHTGERPYKCTVCRATFVYPEHFKKHSRIHSGEKPFGCEVCGKSFSSRDNRNAHRFIHSDKKPYECTLCGAGFMRKPLLLAHMNAAGHLTETIVVNQPRVNQIIESDGVISHTIDMNAVTVAENMGDQYLADTAAVENGSEDESQNNKDDLEPVQEGERRILLRGADDQIYTVNLPANVSEGDVTFTTDDGKTTLNIVQAANDQNILTSTEESSAVEVEKPESSMLQASHKGELTDADDEQGAATGDASGMIRLVQIQLSDGNTGWAMINS